MDCGNLAPSRGSDTRNPVLRWNLSLIDGHPGELARVLVPLKRVRVDGRHVDLAAKVTRQVTEVRALLYDWARALGLVPPVGFRDCLVRTRIARDRRHDRQVVLDDDLFHKLHRAQVAEHVPDRADRAALVDRLRDPEGLGELARRARRRRLLNEHRDPGETPHDLHLDVAPGLERTAEHGRGPDDNSARGVPGGHVADEVFEGLEHACVLICGAHESLAFLLENSGCTLDSGVDEGDDFETRTKLAMRWVSMAGAMVDERKNRRTVQNERNGSTDPHRILAMTYIGVSSDCWGGRWDTTPMSRRLTEHDVPRPDEYDIEVRAPTNMGRPNSTRMSVSAQQALNLVASILTCRSE